MLGTERVREVGGLVEIVDEHDGGLHAVDRRAHPGGVLRGGDPRREPVDDSSGELGRVGDEHGGGELVVLGLAHEVGGDEVGVGRIVGDDEDVGGTGFGVDARHALDEPLRRGDVHVAGTGHPLHGIEPEARHTVRERADRAGAAHGVDLLMPRSAATPATVGCTRPSKAACGGEASAIDRTPATCAGTTFMTTLDG